MKIIIFLLLFITFVISEPKSAKYEISLTKDFISYCLSNSKIINSDIKILDQGTVSDILKISDNVQRDIKIMESVCKNYKTISTNDIDKIMADNPKIQLDIKKLYPSSSKTNVNFADVLNRIIHDNINAQLITNDGNLKNKMTSNINNILEQRFSVMKDLYNDNTFNKNFPSFKKNCKIDENNMTFTKLNGDSITNIKECYDSNELKKQGKKIDNGHFKIINTCHNTIEQVSMKCS